MLQEERQAREGEGGATSQTEKGSPQSKGKIATAGKEGTITRTTAETTATTRITTAEAKKKKNSGNRHATAATGKQAGVGHRDMYRKRNRSRTTGARPRQSTHSVKGLGGGRVCVCVCVLLVPPS